MKSPFANILLDNSFNFDYPPNIQPTPAINTYVTPTIKATPTESISCTEKFIDEKFEKIKNAKHSSNFSPAAISSVEKRNNHNTLLVSSLESQIECLKNEVYFLREEMREKNYMIKTLLNKTTSLDLKSTELVDEKIHIESNNKMNEILDELNRTNKSLNDLSKAITISSSKHVKEDLSSYNGICSEDTMSPSEPQDNNKDRKDDTFNDRNPFNYNDQNCSPSNPFYSHTIDDKCNITYRNHKMLNVKKSNLDSSSKVDFKVVDSEINNTYVVNSEDTTTNEVNDNKNDDFNCKNNTDDNISDSIGNINECNSDLSNEDNSTNNDEIINVDKKQTSDYDKIKNDNTNAKTNTELQNNDLKEDDKKNSQERKTIFIVGDSMIKELKGFELAKSIGHKKAVKIRSHPSAQIRCLVDHIQPIIRNNDTEHVLLHIGTNDLKSEKTPVQICHDIIHLTSVIRDKGIKVSISGIIQRNDQLNNKVLLVNDSLKKICESIGITFINNGNIRPDLHLNASKLHLNRRGNSILIGNVRKYLNKIV